MSDGPYCPFINDKRKLVFFKYFLKDIFAIETNEHIPNNFDKLKEYKETNSPVLLSALATFTQSNTENNHIADYGADVNTDTLYFIKYLI